MKRIPPKSRSDNTADSLMARNTRASRPSGAVAIDDIKSVLYAQQAGKKDEKRKNKSIIEGCAHPKRPVDDKTGMKDSRIHQEKNGLAQMRRSRTRKGAVFHGNGS